MSNNKRLLFIDIEWMPATAYVWKMWDENISPDQLIDDGGMLCFCAHWDGEKDFMFWSLWDDGREGMAKAALELFEQADAVVTYNGDKYDIPKITGEILLAGLNPPPPVTSIDVLKAVKKFGFVMNRLAFIGPKLGVGGKVKHQGFNLWKDVMDGKLTARKRMRRYCIQDVRLLKRLYNKVKPFIKNHPYLASGSSCRCPICDSATTQKRGLRVTRCYRIQRHQCQDCGHWFETTKTKIK